MVTVLLSHHHLEWAPITIFIVLRMSSGIEVISTFAIVIFICDTRNSVKILVETQIYYAVYQCLARKCNVRNHQI